jgi:L-threonylcarbamoyladenylate synthase
MPLLPEDRYQTIITNSVVEAAAFLRQGQPVIFPTETVYGLGANALDPQAAQRIYTAKNRPADNPLIVHIYKLDQITQLAKAVPAYAWELVARFFPGPLTILVYKQALIPDTTTAGSAKVCLRMPSSKLAQEFLQECDLPVAAPSANLSGKPSPTRWQDCLEDMQGRVAAILTGPAATFGLESTIVDCTGTFPVLMRPGSITFEMLRQIVPTVQLAEQLKESADTKTILPGSKYRHYSPRASVILLEPDSASFEPHAAFGYIGLRDPAEIFKVAPAYSLKVADLEEYGRELFAFFRESDRRNLPLIYAQTVAVSGVGRALMNRLLKASSS